MKDLEGWLEEKHPTVYQEYQVYYQIEFKEEEQTLEKYLEKNGRTTFCPNCNNPIFWVQPENKAKIELFIQCSSPKDEACLKSGVWVKMKNGEIIDEKNIVNGQILVGEEL